MPSFGCSNLVSRLVCNGNCANCTLLENFHPSPPQFGIKFSKPMWQTCHWRENRSLSLANPTWGACALYRAAPVYRGFCESLQDLPSFHADRCFFCPGIYSPYTDSIIRPDFILEIFTRLFWGCSACCSWEIDCCGDNHSLSQSGCIYQQRSAIFSSAHCIRCWRTIPVLPWLDLLSAV